MRGRGMAMFARGVAVSLAALFIGASVLGCVSPGVAAGSQAQLSIGFESGWDSSWSANDYNSASGLDYWDISTYRSHSGGHSAYCAEVGTNSINSIANNVNHYYDQDMNAWLEIPIGDISAWDSATVSFYTWYVTGSWSLADYLQVANSSDGSTFWVRWTQTDLSSSGWQYVSFNLATGSTSIAFIFTSDPTVGLGPYEGVYVDDIAVTVTDSSAPVSSISSLSTYQTTASFSVPYTASDVGGGGLAYLELYYRLGVSGAFTLYTTGANPSGHWASSPIEFDSSTTGGDGSYQLYTCAVDATGNQEAAPVTPDASTTVDTVAPTTSEDISGTLGSDDWYTSPVTIALEASDDTSGVASTHYEWDDHPWLTYSGSFLLSAEGAYNLTYYSIDNAGNIEEPKTVTIYVDMHAPTTTVRLNATESPDGWYGRTGVLVELWPYDSAGFVDETRYRIDNGTWQTYHERFNIAKEGTTVIDYYSTDFAGNVEAQKSVSFRIDGTDPVLAVTYPLPNAKISTDTITIEWSGADYLSGIDHYEVQIDGGTPIPLGSNATSYELKGLSDGWHVVVVTAVDKVGNGNASAISFGIYTSIWSQNGPYHGIPLYALIAAIILAAIVAVLFLRKRKGRPTVTTVPKEDTTPQTQ
jgi:hypothetical protein